MVIIKELLKSKGQIILQGPPGTSKTYEAKELAEEMTSEGKGEYKTIQFHPAYSYEDFVRGIVAETTENNQVAYKTKDKVLVEYAKKAKAKAKENEDKAYVLIIDEINRANLPAVLGELIYALEYRNKPVKSPYEGEDICIPKNLYIIGTMNTADRSVGHIDYAIRRRFAFVEMLPKKEIIKSELGKKLFGEVEQLFVKNGEKSEYLSPDFRWEDVQIGHTYFMFMSEGDKEDDNEGNAKEELARRLKYEIKPILKEYLKDGVLLDTAKSKIKELTV